MKADKKSLPNMRSLEKLLDRVGWFKEIKENRFSDMAFESFVGGAMTPLEYWELMDAFRDSISGYVADKSLLKYKLDRRTLGEFCLWIYHQTLREAVIMGRWADMAKEIGLFSKLEYKEHGCDHRGKLLLFPHRQSKAADYKVACRGGKLIPDGDNRLVEVKFDPSLTKLTLKVKDVDSYLEQQCYVLCVLTDKVMVGPNGKADAPVEFVLPEGKTYWCLISPEALKRIRDDRACSVRGEMGDKDSIQLTPENYGNYFVIEQWGKCSQRNGLARPWEDRK